MPENKVLQFVNDEVKKVEISEADYVPDVTIDHNTVTVDIKLHIKSKDKINKKELSERIYSALQKLGKTGETAVSIKKCKIKNNRNYV